MKTEGGYDDAVGFVQSCRKYEVLCLEALWLLG